MQWRLAWYRTASVREKVAIGWRFRCCTMRFLRHMRFMGACTTPCGSSILNIVRLLREVDITSWGAKGPGFKSRRPDHFSVRGILVHIFHGPANSTHRRGGRFPLLLTRCGDPFSTADRSGAATFSGAARRMRAARFVRLASNRLRIGAAAGMGGVSCGVGRSARAARPPRRAAVSAF